MPLDELDPSGFAQLESEYTDPREFASLRDRLKRMGSTEDSTVHSELYAIYSELSRLSGLDLERSDIIEGLNPDDFHSEIGEN